MNVELKNTVTCILAAAIVAGTASAGTMAFVNGKHEINNTFTSTSDLASPGTFKLLESPVKQNKDGTYSIIPDAAPVTSNSYMLLPGANAAKDPYVSIKEKTSAPSYLYVEAVDGLSESRYINWEPTDEWTRLNGITGNNGGTLYLYTGGKSHDGGIIDNSNNYDFSHIPIIKNDTVYVDKDAYKGGLTEMTLSFYAYLAQASSAPASAANPIEKAAGAYIACFPG